LVAVASRQPSFLQEAAVRANSPTASYNSSVTGFIVEKILFVFIFRKF